MKKAVQLPVQKFKMKKNTLFTFLVAALFFSACGPDYLFKEEKTIAGGRWAYADTLDFSLSISDTQALYKIAVNFAYADTFPSQNIYARFYTRFPDGKRLTKPLSFDFFDTEGKSLGKCSGHTCSSETTIQENAFFEKPGQYVITLEQFGRIDPLPGVKSVGLSVQKTGKKK